MIPLAITFTIILFFGFSWLNVMRGQRHDRPKWLPNKLSVYFLMALLSTTTVSISDIGASTEVLFNIGGLPLHRVTILLLSSFMLTLGAFSLGWGKYFPHGRSTAWNDKEKKIMNIWEEVEFPPADWYADWKMGKRWTGAAKHEWVIKWKTHAMRARWVMIFPLLFLGVAFITQTWFTFPVSIAVIWFVADIYKKEFDEEEAGAVARSEKNIGRLLGLAHSVAVWEIAIRSL